MLKKSKTLSELAMNLDASETLIVILAQLFSVERDPGEHNILDGYSGFIEGEFSNGKWILGDHQVISGFGLLSWRTFPVNKTFEAVSSINRMGKGLAAYKSSHESWGYRGVGLTGDSRLGKWLVSLSHNLHDGEMDSTGMLNITDTGDHSSYSSLERENTLKESVLINRWVLEEENYTFGFMGY